MRNILLVLMMVLAAGCKGGAGGTADATQPIADDPGAPADPSDPADPGDDDDEPEQLSVTFYTRSFTEAPVAGWPTRTYTATGYCAIVEGDTYCWSDGVHVIDFTHNHFRYGPYGYNYFALMLSSGSPANCHGGCTNDFFETPKRVTTTIQGSLAANAVSDVFSGGTPATVTCDVQGDVVDCGVFEIDLGAP